MDVFDKIISGEFSSKKVYEDDDVLAILDLSQQTKGHTLVIPKKCVKNMLEIDEETLLKTTKVVHMLCKKLKEKLNCDGFNIVNNCNEVAGQTVPHFHIHIIPRYNDDNSKLVFINNYDKANVSDANNEGLYDLDEVLNTITK